MATYYSTHGRGVSVESRKRLGIVTPSSNTVLEPLTSLMLTDIAEASAHFTRIPVTSISLTSDALHQFDESALLAATRLLTHAKVDVVVWSGTAAAWLGFDSDEHLCRRIEDATGIPACTSVLALNEILAATGVKKVAFVTPYRDDVQTKIIANYEAAGFNCVAERHLGLEDNFSFSEVAEDEIRRLIVEVAAARPDAIAICCTNLRGAPLVEKLEAALGVPIYDSVATAVWMALRKIGVDASRVSGWGRIFRHA
jgi:maleate isomerase